MLHPVSVIENDGVTGQDIHFETGKPVTFRHLRNTKPAPNLSKQTIPYAHGPKTDPYQQGIEPHGRYMMFNGHTDQADKDWEVGQTQFKNPLVINFTQDPNDHYGPKGWKARLSQAFGGKTGKALSMAVAKAGYDGIVTVWMQDDQPAHTKEIVDLRMFHRAVNPTQAWVLLNCKFSSRTV